MRGVSESLPSKACGILFLAVCFATLCLLPMLAQKASETSPPKYDLRTETKIKGTLEEVKVPLKGSEKEVAHLLLKNGTETLDVYLCPKSFLDDMGVRFGKGDEIALTGSKVKQGEADLILAREVVKGNDTLVLPDEKGNPGLELAPLTAFSCFGMLEIKLFSETKTSHSNRERGCSPNKVLESIRSLREQTPCMDDPHSSLPTPTSAMKSMATSSSPKSREAYFWKTCRHQRCCRSRQCTTAIPPYSWTAAER